MRGISSAVQENNFMSDDRIVDMNNLLMKMAKDILIKRTADAKINDLKKRNLPYKAIEEEMRKQISFIPDFDLILMLISQIFWIYLDHSLFLGKNFLMKLI